MLSSRFYPPRPRFRPLGTALPRSSIRPDLGQQIPVAQRTVRIDGRSSYPAAAVHIRAPIEEDSDVRDGLAGAPEEDEIAPARELSGCEPSRGSRLISSVARKRDALFAEHDLNESGAIEARRSSPSPEVGNTGERLQAAREVDSGSRRRGDRAGGNARLPSVGQKDDLSTSARRDPHEPRAEESRHQHGALPGLRQRHDRTGDPVAGSAPPGTRRVLCDRDDRPRLDPSAVAVVESLDPDPAVGRPSTEHPDDLAEEDLAAQLRRMGRRSTEIGRGDRDDAEGSRKNSAHSIPEGTSTNRPNPSRSTNTSRR